MPADFECRHEPQPVREDEFRRLTVVEPRRPWDGDSLRAELIGQLRRTGLGGDLLDVRSPQAGGGLDELVQVLLEVLHIAERQIEIRVLRAAAQELCDLVDARHLAAITPNGQLEAAGAGVAFGAYRLSRRADQLELATRRA